MSEKENLADSDKAYEDYISGMTYKKISLKYGVSENTVKSWKRRYKWTRT
ncbi:RNA polymerase subunit sigma-70, partial [Clostridium botulinum]|nr:RNA polymerase subunit sigma-70 [Clostridium botulinum]